MNQEIKRIIKKIFPNYIINQIIFKKEFGFFFNLKNPKTFNEKIQYRKMYGLNATHSVLADKYRARHVVNSISNVNLVALYGVCSDADEIDWDALPCSFVLKTNHDSGTVFIVKDKEKSDFEEIKNKLKKSMDFDYGKFAGESHYSYIERKIIIEELLLDKHGNVPFDIKVHCFNGEPEFIQVASSNHATNDLYTTDWEKIDVEYLNPQSKFGYEKPKELQDILRYSRELSKEFDYVRVDLFIVNGKVYFGEMTFTPNNGFGKFIPNSYDIDFGSLWGLKKVRKRCSFF